MMRKIGEMGKGSRYTFLSVGSLGAVALLHLIHWLSMPLLLGAAAEMKAHEHRMSGSGSGFIVMNTIMLAVFLVNLASIYFAVRQLSLAWKGRGSFTKHMCMCCVLSVGVLGVALYSTLTL